MFLPQLPKSMWVIAGRNDLEYLSAYLPRAIEFSDDGCTWRAGYGPRLRNWNGVDQLAAVVDLLTADRVVRRAVMTIFDPNRDYAESKDVPCNNWLHFISRGGRLDLHVAARSTDIWWGFSGINAFEWTLLLEMVAYWLGLAPGRLVFFTSSMHLYERHFDRAKQLLESSVGEMYTTFPTDRSDFSTAWPEFPAAMAEWMRIEKAMRSGASLEQAGSVLKDPLLTAYAQMLDVYWAHKRHDSAEIIQHLLAAVSDGRLRAAAQDYLRRF